MCVAVEYATKMVTKQRRTGIKTTPKSKALVASDELFLRDHRKKMGVKAKAIAEAFGIDEKSVYRVEREFDRLSYSEIALYARTIGVPVWQLSFKPEPDIPPPIDPRLRQLPPKMRTAIYEATDRLIRAEEEGSTEK